MKKYFFSILVRIFLALSGFLVFLISARLFGAEGRGIISYGTSLFAFIGLLLSFNFGRTFLEKTKQDFELKRDLLPTYISLNLISSLASVCLGLTYWFFSKSAQSILTTEQAILISFISFFYVWSINGNYFYAAFLKTYYQEFIIATTRFMLIVFLILFLLYGKNLEHFIFFYVLILSFGVFAEIITLYIVTRSHFFSRNTTPFQIFDKNILINHLDYLAFNTFPLILIIISGFFLEKTEIGKVNFAIQICNLIYLFSTTANIRVNSYISDVGFKKRIPQLQKLFIGTLVISVASALVIFFALKSDFLLHKIASFSGVENFFLISILSIPGYILYQFLSPIWLELQKVSMSCKANTALIFLFTGLSFVVIPKFKSFGVMSLFAGFYILVFVVQFAIAYKAKITTELKVT